LAEGVALFEAIEVDPGCVGMAGSMHPQGKKSCPCKRMTEKIGVACQKTNFTRFGLWQVKITGFMETGFRQRWTLNY
jgi:hypothetical protein